LGEGTDPIEMTTKETAKPRGKNGKHDGYHWSWSTMGISPGKKGLVEL